MKTQFVFALGLAGAVLVTQAKPLVVHEWGTFTSLQDEAGRTLGGINTDDEPVPKFCHDLDRMLILGQDQSPLLLFKGVYGCHPDVTMRLETPVIYFHLPADAPAPLTASVRVSFRGGWLTQFYPAAEAGGFSTMAHLTEDTTGTLAWNNLKIGVRADGPQTAERVWTAPRAVTAAALSATNSESEKFLFYRGVGHLVCPLQVSRTADGQSLEARTQCQDAFASGAPLAIPHLWLASFRPDGTCAFRSLSPVPLGPSASRADASPLFSVPAQFGSSDYSAAKVTVLRGEMHRALVEEGLFADEADALLNTWELSYFKSPGLRLFFMVPRAWTDHYLPLDVSVPCEIKRAMVGRLELVTPEQRALLAQLSRAPVPTKPWATYEIKDNKPVIQGAMPSAYRELGRFRNALLLDEAAAHPTKSLEAFIRMNRLQVRPQG
jgi:hypothetical protein